MVSTVVEGIGRPKALGFGTLSFEVVAAQHLRVDTDVPSAWISDGDDPIFLLAPVGRPRRMYRGHVRIRADLRPLGDTVLEPLLYFADESGFSATRAIPLRATAEGIDEVIVLPRGVKELRIDPLVGDGRFTFSQVSILRPTLRESSKRHLRVLGSRSRVAFEAIPQRDLERLHGRGGRWRTGGDDPWYALVPSEMNRDLPRGWVRITAKLAPEGSTKLDPILYFDEGDGFRETSAIPLRVEDGGIEVVTFVPRTVQAFRLDPLSGSGTFTLSDICITSLTGLLGREPSLRQIQALNARRRFSVDAVPQHHLKAHPSQDNLWHSSGDDPSFALFASGLTREPPRGWIRIEARLLSEGAAKLDPVLYFDDGKGFREGSALRLRVRDGRIDDTVFIPAEVVALRLDPMSATGTFSLSDITIRVIGRLRGSAANLINVVDVLPADKRGPGALFRQAATFFASTRRGERWQRFLDASRPKLVPASYAAWIEQVEKPAHPTAEEMRGAVARLRSKPLISIVMPVYNTPERWLRAALASVSAQGYPHWELCLCDDNSSAPHIWPMLEAFAKREPRVKLHRRTENGRIAVASNDAMAMATGQYITLMDHDDVIPDHALLTFAKLLDEDSTIDFIYSD